MIVVSFLFLISDILVEWILIFVLWGFSVSARHFMEYIWVLGIVCREQLDQSQGTALQDFMTWSLV
jgi:hypothetical protein